LSQLSKKNKIGAFGLLELEIWAELNSVWAAGQIPTSPLLLRFGLPNSRIESCIPHECFRPMS